MAGGVTVFCDPTLAPAFRALDGLGGLSVAPLCAPGPLMLAQITRHTRDDVLVSLQPVMEQAAAAGLIDPSSRIGGLANTLVLAARAGTAPPPPGRAALAALVAGARLAITDPTPAAAFDGRAVLAANGLSAASLEGAANTADVAFLVATGAADLGLVYRTDVRDNPRLVEVAALQADPALTAYVAALNARAVGTGGKTLLAQLRSPAATARLQEAGLTCA